jgi:hypothetical protein
MEITFLRDSLRPLRLCVKAVKRSRKRSGFRQKAALFNSQRFAALCRGAATAVWLAYALA